MSYTDGYWWSNDNLRLHYRDYPGHAERPPIVCLPGLTRNGRDFEGVAHRLSPAWRVITVDFRGRGESAYAKDPMSYAPLIYLQDVERLLAELKLERVVLFGTSLGGLVTMLLAGAGHARLAGVLLNDIGPTIETAGLDRIRSYVGRAASWPTWVHAARALGENNAIVYPRYALEDWLRMAKQLYRLTPTGRIVPDYDKNIAEAFRLPGGEAGLDMWPALGALGEVPTLILRGETSDILSDVTAREMQSRLPGAAYVTVPGVGHAPTLDEPVAITAIHALLARVKG